MVDICHNRVLRFYTDNTGVYLEKKPDMGVWLRTSLLSALSRRVINLGRAIRSWRVNTGSGSSAAPTTNGTS